MVAQHMMRRHKKQKTAVRSTARQTKKSQDPNGRVNFVVFDFESEWDSVKPHLDNPKLQDVLKHSLDAYLAHRANLCVHLGLNPKPWQIESRPGLIGPWQYGENLAECEPMVFVARRESCTCDWCRRDSLCFPQPDTLQWYQVPAASPWLAAWQKELGQMMFPKLRWDTVTDGVCGMAVGIDKAKKVRVVFDMMHKRSESELAEFGERNDEPLPSGRQPRAAKAN
jgi:hypothetical protein